MSSLRKSLYNPLDQSQLAFVPIHTDDFKSDSESSYNDEIENTRDLQLFQNYGEPLTLQQSSNTSLSTTRSSSSEDCVEVLSQLSADVSLSSNVINGIRYRIVLKLTSREIKLVRDSWELLTTDDRSVETKSSFYRRIFRDRSKSETSLTQSRPKNDRNNSSAQSSQRKSIRSVPTSSSAKSLSSSLFCAQFYSNFLAMDPELVEAFPSLKHQATAFAGVLTMAISNLEDLSTMESYLNNLGKRHARVLGIHPPQFELMGQAFLRTIRDRFGVYSTFELEETWSRLYSYLANSILQFGIDPILKDDQDKSEIYLPIPNMVQNKPASKILPEDGPTLSANASSQQKLDPIPPINNKLSQYKTLQTKVQPPVPEKKSFSSKLKGRSKHSRLSSTSGAADSDDCIIM